MGVTKEKKRCMWCGKPFKQKTRKLYYCSRGCFLTAVKERGVSAKPAAFRNYQRRSKQREESPNLRHTAVYKRFRGAVLERADFKCEVCGEAAVDVHHKVPICVDPGELLDIDNGMALCLSCHHKQHPDLPKEMFQKRGSVARVVEK